MPKFHVDLAHLKNHAGLKFAIGARTFDLEPHTERTIAQARSTHPAFQIMPGMARRFTHFVDVRLSEFPEHQIRWTRVVRPHSDPSVFIPEIVLMGLYCPDIYMRGYYARKLAANPRYRPAKMAFYGLKRAPGDYDAALNGFLAAHHTLTAFDTAAGLVFHHPELANGQPYYATTIVNDHIAPSPDEDPDQYNAIVALQSVITNPTNQPWSPTITCKDKDGNPLNAAYSFGEIPEGAQLYTNTLTDATVQASLTPIAGAKRSAYDDVSLQNQTWSVQAGRSTVKVKRDVPGKGGAKTRRRKTATAPRFKWTVNEDTPSHGLSPDSSSITIDDNDSFSIDVSNTYLRTLYAYYQLLDENGTPSSSKTKIGPISAVNTIMGIPMPTDPTTLKFDLNKAPSVKLLFGGLGTSDWDGDVSPKGGILTGLWQYGIPILFFIAGATLSDTQPLNKMTQLLSAAALKDGEAMAGNFAGLGAGTINTRSMMFVFADAIVGLIVGQGMAALGTYVVGQCGAGVAEGALGPVGIAFKLLAAGVDLAEVLTTTGEILSCPATLKVTVTRTIDVKLTLHPDPAHGEAGNPASAVWPALAQTYLATLQYKDGTTRQITGTMLPTTNNQPLALLFSGVPAGGQFRLLAGVYSQSGWLAGSWQSDWMKAEANHDDDTLVLPDASIKENLVPLTGDTQYIYKESIAYQNGDYVWEVGKPPTATVTSLDPGPNGTLAELTGITLNNSAFQIGYGWRASGQNIPADDPNTPPTNEQLYSVQNLSVLAAPGSRLKFSQIGFVLPPSISYSPSVNNTQIDQTNFILDPRGGTSNLRRVTLDNQDGGPTDFGLTAPDLKSWGSFPTTDLDAIAVHPTSRLVVAVSWKQHKMMLLSLPPEALPDTDAPVAVIVSGEGVRQGLMKGPKAITIAVDGRILVLESLNERIQAFDTKGNPVPSFVQRPKLFSLALDEVATDFDAGKMPAAVQRAMQDQAVTFLFELPNLFVAQLDSGVLQPAQDPLVGFFSTAGVVLTYNPNEMGDHTVSSYVTVVDPGKSWTVTDPIQNFAYQITNQGGTIDVFRILTQTSVHTIQAGHSWILTDTSGANTWLIQPTFADPARVDLFAYLSYTPLYNPARRTDISYLDMATEAQGYIYVQSYAGDGSQAARYNLDVYAPDGTFLFRSPNPSQAGVPQYLAAARIAVDVWRNLYALNYALLDKPAGERPEPSISHWMPTPPLFSLPLSAQPDFDSRNIAAVIQSFAANQITLSPTQTFITVKSDAGYYQVQDPSMPALYDVFRSGDALQVYSIQL
jgi:hypothetical protein